MATLLKSHSYTVVSARRANLGSIGQCHLTFQIGSKCFTDKFIVIKDLWRYLISGLNWQSNYKIAFNWNIKRHQCITYSNKYSCTSMPSTDTKPIICNAGAFYLQPRNISVITVQTTNQSNTQHIYALNISNDLPSGLIHLVSDHKVNHKYPVSLSIPILYTTYTRVCVLRSTVFGTLNPIAIESTEVSNVSWTKTEKAQDEIRNSPTELQAIPRESSFQPECNISKRQSVILQHAQVP